MAVMSDFFLLALIAFMASGLSLGAESQAQVKRAVGGNLCEATAQSGATHLHLPVSKRLTP